MTQANSSSIKVEVKSVGAIIRDWVTPFSSLGTATAFAITVLTLLDPGGTMVRWITAVLVLLTIMAWAMHRVKTAKTADADADAAQSPAPTTPAGARLHSVLLAVTLFFGVGLLVSEAVMRERRHTPADFTSPQAPATPAPTATPTSTPALTSTPTPTAAPEPAPTAVAPAPALPVATPAPVPAPMQATEDKAQPHNGNSTAKPTVPATAPKRTTSTAETSPPTKPAAEPRAEPRVERPAKAAAPADPRCSSLIAKFSVGQTLSDADKQYLETSCR